MTWLVEPTIGDKCSLPLVTFLNAHIVVAPAHVELGEPLGLPQSTNNVSDQGERVGVLDCELVDPAVILHKVELPVLLLDEEDW